MEYYTSNAIDTPAKPPPFDPVGLQPDSMVKVVTTADEGLALSEHHNHMVRVEAVAGELVYVLAPEPEKAATQHIGTMRGKYLEETLSKIESHLQQQSSGTMTNTTAAHTTLSEASCSVTWCFVAWGCIYKDGHCGGCIIFWCW